jgi:hypothetical protein
VSIEPGKVGEAAASLMDLLDERYDGDETAMLRDVVIVAAVTVQKHPDTGDEDEDGWTFVHLRSTAPTWYEQLGLLHAAVLSIEER